jgi:uncharacterized phage-associated protein
VLDVTQLTDDQEIPYDARVVANFILHYHLLRSENLTQLRLYKLLYFAHGWHLVERHRPLVWNYFEAWENGPVIKVVRDNFAAFKEKPIDRFCSMFDFRKGEDIELPHRLRVPEEEFVSVVIEAYRKYSAQELSVITHASGSPWDAIWKARTPVGRFGLRLRDDEILTDLQQLVDNWGLATKSTFA